jgi:DNA-binding transcriptional LysR family regulator
MSLALLNHLEKLSYFVEIAEQGAFHKASKTLRIAQPALSKSVRILEEACGTTFFVRQKTGVKLTASGQILLQTARAILQSAAAFHANLDVHSDARAVGFATHEIMGPLLFPSLAKMQHFGKKTNQISFQIQTHPSVKHLLDLVEAFKFDIAVVAATPRRPKLHYEPLFTDCFQFYANLSYCKKAGLSGKSVIQESDLTELSLIFCPQVLATNDETLGDLVRRRGLELRPQHTVGSIESAVVLTNNGFGIGLLPEKTGAKLYGKNLVKLDVKSSTFASLGKLTFSFVCRKESWKSDAMVKQAFAAMKDVSVE